jgi:hypothetical protein
MILKQDVRLVETFQVRRAMRAGDQVSFWRASIDRGPKDIPVALPWLPISSVRGRSSFTVILRATSGAPLWRWGVLRCSMRCYCFGGKSSAEIPIGLPHYKPNSISFRWLLIPKHLSHSSLRQSYIRRVLETMTLESWMQEMRLGTAWSAAIRTKTEHSTEFLVLISRKSQLAPLAAWTSPQS